MASAAVANGWVDGTVVWARCAAARMQLRRQGETRVGRLEKLMVMERMDGCRRQDVASSSRGGKAERRMRRRRAGHPHYSDSNVLVQAVIERPWDDLVAVD
jgi:hypothetical protein